MGYAKKKPSYHHIHMQLANKASFHFAISHHHYLLQIPLGGVTELGKRAPSTGQISTTEDWLVSIGLPMYARSFTQAGFTSLEQVSLLTERHVLQLGVKDERHVQLLLGAASLLRTQGAQP